MVIALVHREGYTQRIPVARNPSLGNLGFLAKREKLKKSLLKLNHEIADMPDWTEEQIRARARRLSDLAVRAWPAISSSPSKENGTHQ
jgi:hypothetical protein